MKNFPTLLLVLLATSSYATNPQKTPSTIERVTVYLDGAQIQRRASITAQKGVHELVFHNLSPEINKNSIQVAGLMDATILSMSFTLDYLEKKAHSEDAKKLKTSLEELTLHKNAQENILLGLQQEQQLLENNYRITNDKTLMSLEQFKKISTYYGTRINTIYDERYQIALRLKKLGLEIEHTKRELQKIQGNSKEERGTIKLKIDVPVAARLDLGIMYIIRNAGWFPRYDIKAVSTKKPLSMMYKAHIYQQTGCDWKDIKLILSTGDPNTTNSKPIVHPRYLNFVYGNTPIKSPQVVKRSDYKYNPTIKTVQGVIVNENNHPLPGVNIRIDGTSNGTITDFDGAYSIDIKQGDTLSYNFLGFEPQSIPIHATTINVVMEPDLQLLEEVVVIGYSAKTKKFASKRPKLNRFKAKPVAYNTTVTAKQEHITTTNFQITKKHTINSNEEVTIITIDNFEMPADYEHYAAPELNEAVFLTAQLKNWQQYDLLPGEQAGAASGLEDPSGAEDAGNSDQANTEPPETTPPKSRDQLRFEALKARDEAERRIEADMLLMSNIAEALSKNLGQIHYLRTLCFGRNDQKWRRYAREMMQIEAPNNSELRSQFIRAFNAGYYLEQGRHTECSAKVRVDVAALAENSRNLATMLGDPFRER